MDLDSGLVKDDLLGFSLLYVSLECRLNEIKELYVRLMRIAL